MSKGILQPDGTRCYSGPTCERHGKFNSAVIDAVKNDLQSFVQEAMEQYFAKQAYRERHGVNHEEYAALNLGESQFGYFNDNLIQYTVKTIPEFITSSDGYGRYGDDLHINPDIDAAQVAETLFSPKTELAKLAATAYVKANRLDKPESYQLFVFEDYYSEELTLELTPAARAAAVTWTQSFDNTRDEFGVFDYARAHGIATAGLTTADALKETLRAQNIELNADQQAADTVIVSGFQGRRVQAAQAKLNAVEPDPEVLTDKPVGVVYRDINGDQPPVLLEGYGAVKKLRETPTARRRFYVLTPAYIAPPRDSWRYRQVQ